MVYRIRFNFQDKQLDPMSAYVISWNLISFYFSHIHWVNLFSIILLLNMICKIKNEKKQMHVIILGFDWSVLSVVFPSAR